MLNNKRIYSQSKEKKERNISSTLVNSIQPVRLFVDFIVSAFPYAFWRVRLIGIYVFHAGLLIFDMFSNIKTYFVRRMFWGRGGLYKSSFHIAIIVISTFFLITNLASRVGYAQVVDQQEELVFSYASDGNKDMLQQGNSLKSIAAIDPGFPEFSVKEYTVREGDTLASIAKDFEVNKDTIKWANSKILSPFSDDIREGWKLQIPEMDGVLYTVASGDTIDKIISKTENSDRSSIIELNRLTPPNYGLKEGQVLFVPNAKLKPPPKPKPVDNNYYKRAYGRSDVDFNTAKAALDSMPAGTFGNPLSRCSGYRYIRGLSAYHNGVDLARRGDCTISSVAVGTVRVTGYHYLSGFYVTVDHGGGIETNYFHGRPNSFMVSAGQRVSKGQPLMKMGNTGRSTGQHLHLELIVGGRYMNPGDYIPY